MSVVINSGGSMRRVNFTNQPNLVTDVSNMLLSIMDDDELSHALEFRDGIHWLPSSDELEGRVSKELVEKVQKLEHWVCQDRNSALDSVRLSCVLTFGEASFKMPIECGEWFYTRFTSMKTQPLLPVSLDLNNNDHGNR